MDILYFPGSLTALLGGMTGSCSLFWLAVGACFIICNISDPVHILHRNAEKAKDKSRCLCENSSLLYSFDSFLGTVPERMDSRAADNSSGIRNDRVVI